VTATATLAATSSPDCNLSLNASSLLVVTTFVVTTFAVTTLALALAATLLLVVTTLAAHALLDVLSFAHVDELAIGIIEFIDTGGIRQTQYIFFDR